MPPRLQPVPPGEDEAAEGEDGAGAEEALGPTDHAAATIVKRLVSKSVKPKGKTRSSIPLLSNEGEPAQCAEKRSTALLMARNLLNNWTQASTPARRNLAATSYLR